MVSIHEVVDALPNDGVIDCTLLARYLGYHVLGVITISALIIQVKRVCDA